MHYLVENLYTLCDMALSVRKKVSYYWYVMCRVRAHTLHAARAPDRIAQSQWVEYACVTVCGQIKCARGRCTLRHHRFARDGIFAVDTHPVYRTSHAVYTQRSIGADGFGWGGTGDVGVPFHFVLFFCSGFECVCECACPYYRRMSDFRFVCAAKMLRLPPHSTAIFPSNVRDVVTNPP